MKYKQLVESALESLKDMDGLTEDWQGHSSKQRLMYNHSGWNDNGEDDVRNKMMIEQPGRGQLGHSIQKKLRNRQFKQEWFDKASASALANLVLGHLKVPDDLWRAHNGNPDSKFPGHTDASGTGGNPPWVDAELRLEDRAKNGDKLAKQALDHINKIREKSKKPDDDDNFDDFDDFDENGNPIIDDYVDAPGQESLGWDAAEGRYYGP